jgi:hypothetical protein
MIELSEHPGLVDETAQTNLEGLGAPAGSRRYGHTRSAAGERRGQIFLQGHLALEDAIAGEIDDPEAAFADEIDDLELMQARSYGKDMRAKR